MLSFSNKGPSHLGKDTDLDAHSLYKHYSKFDINIIQAITQQKSGT